MKKPFSLVCLVFVFERSLGPITTEIAMLGTFAGESGEEGAGEFFYAEDYHQVSTHMSY